MDFLKNTDFFSSRKQHGDIQTEGIYRKRTWGKCILQCRQLPNTQTSWRGLRLQKQESLDKTTVHEEISRCAPRQTGHCWVRVRSFAAFSHCPGTGTGMTCHPPWSSQPWFFGRKCILGWGSHFPWALSCLLSGPSECTFTMPNLPLSPCNHGVFSPSHPLGWGKNWISTFHISKVVPLVYVSCREAMGSFSLKKKNKKKTKELLLQQTVPARSGPWSHFKYNSARCSWCKRSLLVLIPINYRCINNGQVYILSLGAELQ